MKRITLLLMLMATVLLVASGVAWAVTKTCPTYPKKCLGTSGADVLKSTSKSNYMLGRKGNDTYTNFVRGNSGNDVIYDSGGKDSLVLTAYSRKFLNAHASLLDANRNGNVDTISWQLGSRGQAVGVYMFFDDTRSKPPFRPGRGYIESIWTK